MRVSVVICTFNRAGLLGIALESLSRVRVPDGLDWELLVVDNNSRDDTRRVAERAAAPLPCRYIFEGRQGKSFALNTGIAESRGDIVAFTDDDVEFDDGWLEAIIEPFDAADVVGVGGRIIAAWAGQVPRWWRPDGTRRGLMAAIVHFDHGTSTIDLHVPPFGANMAFRRTVFQRVGLFKTSLGPTTGSLIRGEDTELGRRVMDVGRVVYAPRAVVHHPVEPRRARKAYFRRWYFDYGRSMVRLGNSSPDARKWFGVPRHAFRQLASDVTSVVAMSWSRDAFYWELNVWQTIGAIYEWRQIEATRRSS